MSRSEILWAVAVSAGVGLGGLIALLFSGEVYPAVPTFACKGDGYVFEVSTGGSVNVPTATCGTVGVEIVRNLNAGYGGGFTFGSCSVSPLVSGASFFYGHTAGSGSVTVTQRCSPADDTAISGFSVQEILVLCAGFLAFGIGFLMGK